MWEGFDKRWHWLKPIKHQSGSIETYFWHSSDLVLFFFVMVRMELEQLDVVVET